MYTHGYNGGITLFYPDLIYLRNEGNKKEKKSMETYTLITFRLVLNVKALDG